jgi:hypothetical protein
MKRRPILAAALGLALAGCTTLPTGPGVLVLPGSGSSFAAFRADDEMCRGFAAGQIGASPGQAAGERTAAGAALGTGVGAASGALIGAASGEAGAGAAIGAGAGLLLGSAAGASHGGLVGASLQRRYDVAYIQCMYASGHQVPVPREAVPSYAHQPPPPAPSSRIPPPPAGRPPPAPPGADD